MHKDQPEQPAHQSELSDAWQELLGRPVDAAASVPAGDPTIPTLARDPWQELLHARGTEVIDLHAIHLHMSDQDVEEALQIMQEQPSPNADPSRDQASQNQ